MEWMMFSTNFGASEGFGFAHAFWMLPLLIWTLVWTGWALWLAARRRELIWFIVLLVLNTAGILEIIYIFFIAKRSDIPENRTFPPPEEKPKEPFLPPQIGS